MTRKKTIKVESKELRLSVPYLEGLNGYTRKRVDCTLTGSQAQRLKGILQALQAQNAKLSNGRIVAAPQHAIQWMIENAAEPKQQKAGSGSESQT